VSDDPYQLGLAELVTRLHARSLSALEVVRAALNRAEALQPHLNTFIHIDREGAESRARRLDSLPATRRRSMPLFGVPVAHKDLFIRRGRRTTYGSKLYVDNVPAVTATATKRLDAAGAVDLGGLNMSEFACNPYGLNILVGRARNPWEPERIAGGSSSGSAVAVAAGLVYASLGSDTGGSVRLPAAICGTFGLLPTNGRISRYGMLPLSHSLDNAGPLARSAKDIARILSVVAGRDAKDPTASRRAAGDYEGQIGASIRCLRIAIPTRFYREECDEDTAAACDDSIAVFRSLGAEIVATDVPDPGPMDALGNTLILSEAAAYHARDLAQRGDLYTPLVRKRIEFGFSFDAATYVQALRLRAPLLKQFLDAVFQNAELLLLPVLPHVAPHFSDVEKTLQGQSQLSFPLAKFTRWINYLGLPALTVPHGWHRTGMPLAFQLVGRPFDEALILRAGYAFERAAPLRWPKLPA
jgi:aspartyl-tRNA(Asn)/glutamyl-tRNA(Gln) amidotransferase subunit A